MKNVVRNIAITFTVAYAAFIVVAMIFVVQKELSLEVFIGIAVSVGISLILLWALDNALARIERLENILSKKDVITDKDVELETFGYVEETPENVSECPKCGYQLFPEDKVCPNCQTPRDDTNENK